MTMTTSHDVEDDAFSSGQSSNGGVDGFQKELMEPTNRPGRGLNVGRTERRTLVKELGKKLSETRSILRQMHMLPAILARRACGWQRTPEACDRLQRFTQKIARTCRNRLDRRSSSNFATKPLYLGASQYDAAELIVRLDRWIDRLMQISNRCVQGADHSQAAPDRVRRGSVVWRRDHCFRQEQRSANLGDSQSP